MHHFAQFPTLISVFLRQAVPVRQRSTPGTGPAPLATSARLNGPRSCTPELGDPAVFAAQMQLVSPVPLASFALQAPSSHLQDPMLFKPTCLDIPAPQEDTAPTLGASYLAPLVTFVGKAQWR